MEVGANRKSVAQLAVAVGVLAIVVYFQFFRGPSSPVAQPVQTPPVQATPTGAGIEPESRRVPGVRRTSGRFRPRLGRTRSEDAPDPMTADVNLRRDLLDRVRRIEPPEVDRDIFNFGKPRPAKIAAPTAAETEQAQARLTEAMKRSKPAPPPPTPRRSKSRARPPAWKYYGLASLPGQTTQRAFLLDHEEILVAGEGMLLRERYLIRKIGPEDLVLEDLEANQEFTIALEASP